MQCAACEKPGARLYCQACHGGKLYCSQECLESARPSHELECARLPLDWGIYCQWRGKDVGLPLLQQGATRRPMSVNKANHSYHVPAEVDVFKPFHTDCALFVQAVKLFSEASPKAAEELKAAREAEPDKTHTWFPTSPVFGLGSHAVWHMMGAAKEEAAVEVSGESLKAGYMFPTSSESQILTLQNFTPGAGMWVLGPDKHDRYLGMGQEGPARKTFSEWAAFLAATIQKDGERLEAQHVPLGRSMQILGAELIDSSRWELSRFPATAPQPEPAPKSGDVCGVCGAGEKSSLFHCAECHGGVKYCSIKCFDKAWKDGHDRSCARIPRNWKMNLVWNETTLYDAFKNAGCAARVSGDNCEFIAGTDAFKTLVSPFNTDCSAFVQLMKMYSEAAKGKGDKEAVMPAGGSFGLGPVIPWVKMTGLIFEDFVEIAGEKLKVGYLFPTDLKNQRFEEMRDHSAGNGMWLLGPDRNERYLGMGKTGALRRSLREWSSFLAATISDDGVRLEKEAKSPDLVLLGKAFQLAGAALSNPAHWKLIHQMSINS